MELFLEGCVSALNHWGIGSGGGLGAGAETVWISNCSVYGSTAIGVSPQSGGQIISFGNNRIDGNASDGSPSSTTAQE